MLRKSVCGSGLERDYSVAADTGDINEARRICDTDGLPVKPAMTPRMGLGLRGDHEAYFSVAVSASENSSSVRSSRSGVTDT